MFTPLEITLLLECHVGSFTGNNTSKAQELAIDRLRELGLIRNGDPFYGLTERGSFYVEHGICKLPLPIQTWVIPSRPDTADKAVE